MAGFFLRKILPLGVALVFLNLVSVLAEEDLSPPTGVSLKYEETRPGEKTVCSGGGLLGAMNCVTARIEGAGADGKITSTAALSLTLTPVLRAEGNRREVKVYVRVDVGSPSISTNFENQQQVEADVNSDARLVKERLKRWNASLGAGQLDDLKTKGETQVRISRPFEGLKRLALENPPATLTLRMPPFEMDMKFLVKDGDGYSPAPPSGVGYGEVFVVEVTFTQPQSEPTFYVDLNWEGAFMKYEARLVRADNTGKLYRSDELRARYLNGPGVETAVDPGGP
ncbi:MAG: hypothetical protein IH995_05900 [Proteobacteria bacterium]|nr:hypothetical protein [Pseudomonadota bacterium]